MRGKTLFVRSALRCSSQLIAVLCAAILTGCASSGVGQTLVSFDKHKTRLAVFALKDGRETITKDRPKRLDEGDNAQREQSVVLAKCAQPTAAESGTAVLGILLSSAVNVLMERIDQALQDQIKKYAQAYSAKRAAAFYEPAAAADPNKLTARVACLRFMRAVPAPDSKSEISYVDLVASIDLVNASWLEIRPLRLYFSHPAALSSDKKYGVAFNIKATSLFRNENIGSRQVAFDDVLLSEKIDLSAADDFVKYYDDKDAPMLRVPMPSFSRPIVPGAPRDYTTFEVAIAETGTPPAGLVAFSKIFSGAREDIAKLLATAANKSLGWTSDDD